MDFREAAAQDEGEAEMFEDEDRYRSRPADKDDIQRLFDVAKLSRDIAKDSEHRIELLHRELRAARSDAASARRTCRIVLVLSIVTLLLVLIK